MYEPATFPRLFARCFLVALLAAAPPGLAQTTAQAIDFEAFLQDATEAYQARQSRLLPLEEFQARAGEPGTVVLDTRSADAYAVLHLAGAAHLEFSELTEKELREVVGDPDTTVLIYCNNNFVGGAEPFPTKAPAAALNIPTFVALWTYGYRNVYELGELVEVGDPRIELEGAMASGRATQP